jgi:predicted SnoaL-like aldol condensation-catalyzing enzyme
VLTQPQGAFAGKPTAYYDLFRVENDNIVEHWDVLQPIPIASEAKNKNGMF